LIVGLPSFHCIRACVQLYISVNYGEVADNLPPPEQMTRLLKSMAIFKVLLYSVDAGRIRALVGSSFSVVVVMAKGDIPSQAADPAAASYRLVVNDWIEDGSATPATQLHWRRQSRGGATPPAI
jgi:hypothetical protein